MNLANSVPLKTPDLVSFRDIKMLERDHKARENMKEIET